MKHYSRLQLQKMPTKTILSLINNSEVSVGMSLDQLKKERQNELNAAEAVQQAELRAKRRSAHRYANAHERDAKRQEALRKKEEERINTIAKNANGKGRK